jgi:hypothetical protein
MVQLLERSAMARWFCGSEQVFNIVVQKIVEKLAAIHATAIMMHG